MRFLAPTAVGGPRSHDGICPVGGGPHCCRYTPYYAVNQMANVLPTEKQVAVLRALAEGMSVRSTERMLDVSRETVLSLLVRVGDGCERLLDTTMRDIACNRIEVDEIWSFVAKKQRHVTDEDNTAVVGDTWVWIAIDPESKLVPCYRVGKRDAATANAFAADLAARLRNRVQISSDGLNLYVDAIERAFGARVDYGQIVKAYEAEPLGPGRYSPPMVVSVEKTVVAGRPDPDRICTSIVERQNLSMRMATRRFTRLTNGFSKKLRNHRAAVALWFAHYNLVRVHGTTRVTPAMASGIVNSVWSLEDLLDAALYGVRP
jgi:IS1 family transposase